MVRAVALHLGDLGDRLAGVELAHRHVGRVRRERQGHRSLVITTHEMITLAHDLVVPPVERGRLLALEVDEHVVQRRDSERLHEVAARGGTVGHAVLLVELDHLARHDLEVVIVGHLARTAGAGHRDELAHVARREVLLPLAQPVQAAPVLPLHVIPPSRKNGGQPPKGSWPPDCHRLLSAAARTASRRRMPRRRRPGQAAAAARRSRSPAHRRPGSPWRP